MSTERDPARRESPAGHIVKTDATEAIAQATKEEKAAEGVPGQGNPRQNDVRDSFNAIQSHKSICRLPGSPARTDRREEMYSALDAWAGQSHE